MAKEKRGMRVRAGEQVGYVMHPFTGDIVRTITAPREGVMLHAGASWPVLPEGVTLAILGDVATEHR
jgi:predicted deacylase